MKIFVFGSGGREHALCRALKNSDLNNIKIYCYPSNAGIEPLTEKNMFNSYDDAINFIIKEKIDLVVIGPENYLAEGIVDFLTNYNIRVFGPKKDVAKLESSKLFAKKFMEKYNIPTASYKLFDNERDIKSNIKAPIVLKYDGLAAGKGVAVCKNEKDINDFCDLVYNKKSFGDNNIVIAEELLEGKELSVIIAVSNHDYLVFPYARDHKRAFDNNEGPNTGGMGTIASFDLIDDETKKEIDEKIIKRTLKGFEKENIEYRGFLFIGLILTKKGSFVLEYNVRFGDPEAQSILNLLEGDFARFIYKTFDNNFDKNIINFKKNYSISIIAASKGYPGKYEKDKKIYGLNEFGQNDQLLNDNIYIYHSGTIKKNNDFYTNGGRVFSLSSYGNDLEMLRKKIINGFDKVYFDGMFFRKDIGNYL